MNQSSSNSNMPKSTVETLKQKMQKHGVSLTPVSTVNSRSFSSDTPSVTKELRPTQNIVAVDKTPKFANRTISTTDAKAVVTQARAVSSTSAETRPTPAHPLSHNQSVQDGKIPSNKSVASPPEIRAFGSQTWSNSSSSHATETKTPNWANQAQSEGKLQKNPNAAEVKTINIRNPQPATEFKALCRLSNTQATVRQPLTFEGRLQGLQNKKPLGSPPSAVTPNQGRINQGFSVTDGKRGGVATVCQVSGEQKSVNIQPKLVAAKTANQVKMAQTVKGPIARTVNKLSAGQNDSGVSEFAAVNPFRGANAANKKVIATSSEEKSMTKVVKVSQNVSIVGDNQHSSMSRTESKTVKFSTVSSGSTQKQFDCPIDNITSTPVIHEMSSRRAPLKRAQPPVRNTGLTITPVGVDVSTSHQTPSTSSTFKKARMERSSISPKAMCPTCNQISSDLDACEFCKTPLPKNKQVYMKQKAVVVTKNVITMQQKVIYQFPQDQTFNMQMRPMMQVSPRGGRARGRRKILEPPVCLTLSSDDEETATTFEHATPGNASHFQFEESEGSKDGHSSPSEALFDEPPDSDDETFPGVTQINERMMDSEEEEMEFDEIEEEDEEDEELNKSSDEEENNGLNHHKEYMDPTDIPIECRSIRIGSYKVHPKENCGVLPVYLSKDSLAFDAPILPDGKKYIKIRITEQDITKLLVHFGKCLPIMFIFTTVSFGQSLRQDIHMYDSNGFYFDPKSKDDKVQKITFLIDRVREEHKNFLRLSFPGDKKVQEIDQKTANEILVKSTPTKTILEKVVVPSQAPTSSVSIKEITTADERPPQPVIQPQSTSQLSITRITTIPQEAINLFTYPPPPQTGGITITNEDLLCLDEGEFLNDAIIDFYLKYVFYEKLSQHYQDKTYVFSSYFYPRLTQRTDRPRAGDDTPNMQARRHNQVRTWTRHVDLFSKDFIIIPVNQNVHWFLAIICFPGLVPDAPKAPLKTESPEKSVDNVTSTNDTENVSKVVIKEITDNDEGEDSLPDENSMTYEENSSFREEPDSEEMSSEIPDSTTQIDSKQKQQMPCICIFDSLCGKGRYRIATALREYLEMEWEMRKGTKKVFDTNTMRAFMMKCPQQTNFTDCGMYVLQFVESFFEDPIKSFTSPMPDLTNWFDENIISKKRLQMKALINSLTKKQQQQKKAELQQNTQQQDNR